MALIKCSECSAEISDKANCCPKCGAHVEVHKWRCSKCGNMISGEPCPYCSNAQAAVNTNTVGYESSVGTTPAFVAKNKRNLRVLITILFIAAVTVIVIVLGTQSNSVKKENGSLVGEWVLDNNSSITFFEDGTALWVADVATRTFDWDTNGNIMTWYIGGTPYSYTWEVTDDVLYVDGQYYATRQ